MIISAFVLVMLTGSASAQGGGPDKAKLRELLEPPSFTANSTSVFSLVRRYGIVPSSRDWSPEIAALKKGLKGDASDAESLSDLGDLYTEMNDTAAETEAYARAAELYAVRRDSRPDDADLNARLGVASIDADKVKDGELSLRRALTLDPGSWRALDGMGRLAERRAALAILKRPVGYDREFCETTARAGFTPAEIARVAAIYEEALAYHDKAVAAAPEEAQAYMGRILGAQEKKAFSICVAVDRRRVDSERLFHEVFLQPGVLADIDRIADLESADANPNVDAVAAAVLFDLMASSVGGAPREGADRRFASLRAIEKGTDKRAARTAAEMLAASRMQDVFAGKADAAEVEKDLRLAISLDPARDDPWRMLFLLLGDQKRYADLKQAALETLKTKDWAYGRMVLAQASMRLGEFKEAVAQARKAVALAPDDPKTQWLLGEVALKGGDDASAEARTAFDRAAELSGALPDEDEKAGLAVARAIQAGLSGDAARARGILDEARSNPALDAAAATAVRQALGTSPRDIPVPEARVLKAGRDTVYLAVFSPDGRLLATATTDENIKLWDVATGLEVRTLSGHTNTVSAVAFSPDGSKLVSGAGDNTVRVWDVASGRALSVLKGHTAEGVDSVAYSPDGKLLASGGDDSTVRLWDAASGRELRTMKLRAAAQSVRFSPDGRTLASAGADVRLWDVATGRALGKMNGIDAAFSPDGKSLATVDSGRYGVTFRDARTGRKRLSVRGRGSPINSISFNPDGRQLAAASAAIDNKLEFWDAATGKEVMMISGVIGDFDGIAVSRDGRELASLNGDDVRLWVPMLWPEGWLSRP